MASIRIEGDGVELQGQIAGTYGPYRLAGGRYVLVAAGGTSAQLLISPGPDGATNVPVGAAVTAPALAVYDLPPGSYVVTLVGTGSASVQRVKLG